MKSLNKEPIYTDFNSMLPGMVLILSANGVFSELEKYNTELKEGLVIWVTDHEMEMVGTVEKRNDLWVLVPNEEGYKVVTSKCL